MSGLRSICLCFLPLVLGPTFGCAGGGPSNGRSDTDSTGGDVTDGASSTDPGSSSGGLDGTSGEVIPEVSGGSSSSGGASSASGGRVTGGGNGENDPGSGGALGTGGQGDQAIQTWPLINGVQWADVDGAPIQAHGGGMLKVSDMYYWFGENRNPNGTFYAVSAYRSKDLHNWEHAHDVLTMMSDPELDPANIERPKVVYNAATGKYVMWMHWENGKDYGEARAAVASSDSIDGDYTYHGSFRPMMESGVMDHGKPGYMSRDCTLFVDDDGSAYFLSAANENYDLHLYKLTPDYLEVESRLALLFEGEHREAPALFKKNNRYFLITSGSTGWSPNQARYTSSTQLGTGWSNLSNLGDGTTFYSQSTYVQAVEGTASTEFLYMGDRWAGAWGGRVNDSSYVWQKLTFPTESTLSMSWSNRLDIDARGGTIAAHVNTFSFVNKKSGHSLSVQGSAQEGAALMLGSLPAEDDFRLNYNESGHFKLTHAASGLVVDVPDESTTTGLALQLWTDNGGSHQAWKLIDLGSGEYRVQNQNSGLFLGVKGSATTLGSAIEQQEQESSGQVWAIEPK